MWWCNRKERDHEYAGKWAAGGGGREAAQDSRTSGPQTQAARPLLELPLTTTDQLAKEPRHEGRIQKWKKPAPDHPLTIPVSKRTSEDKDASVRMGGSPGLEVPAGGWQMIPLVLESARAAYATSEPWPRPRDSCQGAGEERLVL